MRAFHEEAVAWGPARRETLLSEIIDGDRERARRSDSTSTASDAARLINRSSCFTVLAVKATVGRSSLVMEPPSMWERYTVLGEGRGS